MRMRPLIAALIVAGTARASAQTFNKVQFIFFHSNDGKTEYNPPRQLVLTKAADIAKLTKFLPGLGLNKGGLKASGWDEWGTIRLMRAKGPGIAVFFPGDAKLFSMIGKSGAFPTAKGFKDYLLDIEKQAKQ